VSEVEVFDSRRCELGEGPHYDEHTGRVWWVDILGCRVLWRTPSAGESGWLSTPGHVGAAVPTSSGRLVVCLPEGPTLLDPVDGRMRPLARYPDASAAIRSNDAKADPQGRLWLGTMAYDERTSIGRLYRLDVGASQLLPVVDDVTISNGLGWSPEGDLMYYIDSATKRIDMFDFDDGFLKNRRPFATIYNGTPDGLCVDADGGVWVAIWLGGEVHRYARSGVLERIVRLPTPLVTSCTFAGPDFRTLIITTAGVGRPDDPGAGVTYAHYPAGVHGMRANVFAG
jgi:sugar lactone lactonase YvrE